MAPTMSLVRGCAGRQAEWREGARCGGVVHWLRGVDVLLRAEGERGGAVIPGMSRSDVGIRKGLHLASCG